MAASYTVDGNVNWCSHSGEQNGGSLNSEYHSCISSCDPPAGHRSGKTRKSKRHMYPNDDAALFTTAKTWKQPEWPLTKEEVKKMMQHYSALKRAK